MRIHENSPELPSEVSFFGLAIPPEVPPEVSFFDLKVFWERRALRRRLCSDAGVSQGSRVCGVADVAIQNKKQKYRNTEIQNNKAVVSEYQ
jgi:hypothetical protein